MKKITLFSLVLLLTMVSGNAQSFKRYLLDQQTEPTTFRDQQESFRQWFRQELVFQAKGYKQFMREAWMVNDRFLENQQTMPGQAYQAHLRRQQANPDRNPNADWIPVGPMGISPSPEPYEVRGVGRLNDVCFHPLDTNTFYVGASNGSIWKTTNSGQSWTPIGDQLPILRISDIAIDPQHPDTLYTCLGDINTVFLNANNLYPTTFGEGVYKSIDGGNTWEATGLTFAQTDGVISLMRAVIIHPDSTENLVAAGVTGIWTSSNGGDDWAPTFTEAPILDIEQDPTAPNILYAATAGGIAEVYKSTDFGENWTRLETGLPQDGAIIRTQIAIAPSNTDYLYLLCAANTGGLYGVYRSTDAGQTWELRADPTTGPNILAWLNGDPELLETEAFGQGEYDLSLMVDPFDENRIYSGGINVWGSADGGLTWDVVSFVQNWFGPSIHQDIHQIAYNPLDQHYYICNDGGLDRTDTMQIGNINFALFNCLDFETLEPIPDCYTLPTQWERLSDGLAITEFYRIGVRNNNAERFIAGAQDNSAFLNNESGWTNLFDGDGMECIIDPVDTNVMYGGMELGRLEITFDGGATVIDEATAPIFDDPTQFPAWVTPLLMHPEDNETLLVGFSDVWQSTDQGSTWAKVSDLPVIAPGEPGLPMRALELAPSDPNVMYLSRQPFYLENFTIPGEMWKSLDGGTTWNNITDGLPTEIVLTSIAIDDENPDLVWVSCSHFEEGLKVFKTTDGGQNWQNISGSLPNLPVNAIMHQTGTENNTVYVATDRGVFYTHDDLADWEPLGNNLPNVIITDLAIQYETNKILAATFGRGVWMTDLAEPVVAVAGPNPFNKNSLQVSPNPNPGSFELTVTSKAGSELTIEIIDVLGRRRFQRTARNVPKRWVTEMQADLSPGIYFVAVSGNGYMVTQKMVVE